MHIFPSGQEGQHGSRPPLLRFCKVLYLSLIVPLTLMCCLPSKRAACSRANKHQRSLHRCWRCSQSARNNKADVQRCVRSTLSSSCMCLKKCLVAAMMGLMFQMKISINPHILLKNTQLTLVYFNNDQSNFLTFTLNQVVFLLKV